MCQATGGLDQFRCSHGTCFRRFQRVHAGLIPAHPTRPPQSFQPTPPIMFLFFFFFFWGGRGLILLHQKQLPQIHDGKGGIRDNSSNHVFPGSARRGKIKGGEPGWLWNRSAMSRSGSPPQPTPSQPQSQSHPTPPHQYQGDALYDDSLLWAVRTNHFGFHWAVLHTTTKNGRHWNLATHCFTVLGAVCVWFFVVCSFPKGAAFLWQAHTKGCEDWALGSRMTSLYRWRCSGQCQPGHPERKEEQNTL